MNIQAIETITRRQFLKLSAGTIYLAACSGVSWPKLLYRVLPPAKRLLASEAPAKWLLRREFQAASPKPIPGGIQHSLSGHSQIFHVFLPGHGNEPSTITDFNGFIGLAHLTGSGTTINTRNGNSAQVLFDADIRFMRGAYIDVKGRRQEGNYGCICLDLFDGQIDFEHQLHHFEPGIDGRGLFWTTAIPLESVRVNPDAGIGSMDVTNLEIRDFYNVSNGLRGGHSVPVTVSLHAEWRGIKQRSQVSDRVDMFDGQFIETRATLEWSARRGALRFVSDAAERSRSEFALIGFERNGIFLDRSEVS